MKVVKIGAIASGSGSNFESIVQSCETGILKEKATMRILLLSERKSRW